PSLHQHRNEFHVPQRRLVVLRDAHPILSDFSPALLGRTKIRSVDFFAKRVRARIFRSLSVARCLSGPWTLDPRRVRDLSPARIRVRNGAGHVACSPKDESVQSADKFDPPSPNASPARTYGAAG